MARETMFQTILDYRYIASKEVWTRQIYKRAQENYSETYFLCVRFEI
jgi:hypothetical protein